MLPLQFDTAGLFLQLCANPAVGHYMEMPHSNWKAIPRREDPVTFRISTTPMPLYQNMSLMTIWFCGSLERLSCFCCTAAPRRLLRLGVGDPLVVEAVELIYL